MSEASPDLRPPPPRAVAGKATRPAGSPMQTLTQWLFDNQANLSFHAIVPFVAAHVLVPAARPYTAPFVTLSYYNPQTGLYGTGPRDLCFVALCVLLCIGIRAAMMQHVLIPLGRAWGVPKKKDLVRFAEQGWMFLYYSAAWPLGMYLYYHSPYFLNLEAMWTGWPQKELGGLMKAYVLFQWAYWIEQAIIVNMEARRKDYWEMIVHHAITTSLIAAAYAYHQTRVGHVILVLMDVSELIFPLAKCLKYVGYTTVCDAIFGVFLVTWLSTRHVFYLMTVWSVYRDLPRFIGVGTCYRGPAGALQGPFPVPATGWGHLLEPFYDTAGTVCWTGGIWTGFLVCLLALELVICVWSFLIVRVTVNVLKGGSAEDVRSDDEAEDEIEADEKAAAVVDEGDEAAAAAAAAAAADDEGGGDLLLIEEEVGVEAIDLTAARRRNTPQKPGLRLSSHSDRKVILNRIGCEKQID